MEKLKQIDQKIDKLKEQKDHIEKQLFKNFYRQAKGILGKDFDPELALVILYESWNNADQKQKESWHKDQEKFLLFKNPKKSSKNSQKGSVDSQTLPKETQDETQSRSVEHHD